MVETVRLPLSGDSWLLLEPPDGLRQAKAGLPMGFWRAVVWTVVLVSTRERWVLGSGSADRLAQALGGAGLAGRSGAKILTLTDEDGPTGTLRLRGSGAMMRLVWEEDRSRFTVPEVPVDSTALAEWPNRVSALLGSKA